VQPAVERRKAVGIVQRENKISEVLINEDVDPVNARRIAETHGRISAVGFINSSQ
jgi:hypothetical protein